MHVILNHLDRLNADPSIPLGKCACGTLVRSTCERCGKHLCHACTRFVFHAMGADESLCPACYAASESEGGHYD